MDIACVYTCGCRYVGVGVCVCMYMYVHVCAYDVLPWFILLDEPYSGSHYLPPSHRNCHYQSMCSIGQFPSILLILVFAG